MAEKQSALEELRSKGEGEDFQARVKPWMTECFGDEISSDKVERGDRLLEETLELLQSGGYDPARVSVLRDYVYARPVGEPSQEVGGVMVCVAAYCLAFGLDMHEAAETELARIWTKVPQIREKQKTKPKNSPLPALAASPAPPDQSARLQELVESGLKAIEDASASCPVRRGTCPEKCPKCGATDRDGCGLEVRAEAKFLAELRAVQGVGNV